MTSPRWYETAILYQTHVRAFRDANGDGIGDFAGLTERLGYVRDLGATAIWLLPFYASPLRDGGYDIADYRAIHPDYGDLHDFDRFVRAAHDKGLKVITELVVNHTSDQHPWFERARRAPPGSEARDWYVWSETGEEYPDVRIIFSDAEPSNWTWDPVAKAYFWHRFFHHQPDLNWDHPPVEAAVHEVMDFWLERGVDGLRLDAIPYLYVREGTTCENLPETHAALKRLRAHVQAGFPEAMLLAEANQWPEQAVSFFGEGDECHMNFAFPLMPRLYLSLETERAAPIVDILEQTPALPEGCGWALFLRNHDELTLEMVTHEERARMWSAYGAAPRAVLNLGLRRRLAPLLGGDPRRVELLDGLLFGLRGTPIVYYGDEIGMGDDLYQPDRDGVRTPMQWSGDRNAGFSEASPQQLYLPVIQDPTYRYEAVNVEAQEQRQGSLLHFTRRLLRARRASIALSAGTQEILPVEAPELLAVLRRHPRQAVLVVANLSAASVTATIPLEGFEGHTPVNLLDGGRRAALTEGALELTLPGHGFVWLELHRPARGRPTIVPCEAGWPRAAETPDADRAARALFSPDPGPTAEIVARPLDDAGRWWWQVTPHRGAPEARWVKEVSEPDADVLLETPSGRVGLADVSAAPETAHAQFASFSPEAAELPFDLRGADARRTPEGWTFRAPGWRAVLGAEGPLARARHARVVAALPDGAPVVPPRAVVSVPEGPIARLEALPEGETAAERLAGGADVVALAGTLAEGLAALHEAVSGSALERAELTPYDARALYQSLRGRLTTRAPIGRGRTEPEAEAIDTLRRGRARAVTELARIQTLPLKGARLVAHGRPGPETAWCGPDGIVWLDLAGAPDLAAVERTVPRSPLEDLAALTVATLAAAPGRADPDQVRSAALEAYRGRSDPEGLPGTEALWTLWPFLLLDAAVRAAARPQLEGPARAAALGVAAEQLRATLRTS